MAIPAAGPTRRQPGHHIHSAAIELRRLRRARGLSLAALSAHTGVPTVVIGAWERGDRRMLLDARVDAVFAFLGKRFGLVDLDQPDQTGTPVAIAATLRYVADRIERHNKPW